MQTHLGHLDIMRIQTFVIYIEITNPTYLGPFKHNVSHGIHLLNRGYHSIPFYVIKA